MNNTYMYVRVKYYAMLPRNRRAARARKREIRSSPPRVRAWRYNEGCVAGVRLPSVSFQRVSSKLHVVLEERMGVK